MLLALIKISDVKIIVRASRKQTEEKYGKSIYDTVFTII